MEFDIVVSLCRMHLCLCFYLLSFQMSFGQQQTEIISMSHISVEDGLASKYVNCGLQDSRGFVWLGTYNGLQRYDGKKFLLFTKERDSLQSNSISSLVEDQDQLIWICKSIFDKGYPYNETGMVDIFDLRTNRIEPLERKFKGRLPFDPNRVQSVVSNEKHELVLLIQGVEKNDKSMYFYTKKSGFIKLNVPVDVFPQEYISTFFFKGNYFGYNTRSSKTLFSISENKPVINFKDINYIIIGIESNGSLLLRNSKTSSIRRITLEGKEEEKSFPFKNLSLSQDARLGKIVGFTDSIAFCQFEDFTFRKLADVQLFSSLSNFSYYNSFSTQDGTIWICTNEGVYTIKNTPNRFKHILSKDVYRFKSNQNSQIRNIYTDSIGRLIVNSWAGFYLCSQDSIGEYICNRIYSPEDDRVYTQGTYFDGVNLWFNKDAEARRLNVYTQKYESNITFKWIWMGLKAKNGFHYLSRRNYIYCISNEAIIEEIKSCNDSLPFNWIQQFYYTRDGSFWAVGHSGLFTINEQNCISAYYSKDQKDEKYRLPFSDFHSMLEDRNGNIWLASNGSGLIKWDRKQHTFSSITIQEGLSSNIIYSILEDERGFLWLSSDYGIIQFDPQSSIIKNFSTRDGLTNNEFNRCAFHQGLDGKIFFGGLDGINAFHPKDFWNDETKSKFPLAVTSLTQYDGETNKIIDKTNELLVQNKIILNPGDKFFTLEFLLLNFQKTINRFAYKISGIDKDWIPLNEGSLRLSGLPYGNFTLKIKALGDEGKNELELALIVNAPFTETLWFRLISLLALIGVIYYFYNQARIRKNERLEANRLKELDEFKSRFFTNISHEFRTPLTVILGSSDQLIEDNVKLQPEERVQKAGLIKRNGQNLLRLINQVLDLSKLENKSLELSYILGNIVNYIQYICENFYALAEVNKITIQLECEEKEIVMDYDPERILQIMHNLISNAIKFSPNGSTISIKVSRQSDQLHISIADEGVGITPEELSKVFERFFQARNQSHARIGGSGIGLSFTKELVKIMGGEIRVSSPAPEKEKGSQFHLVLPITTNSPIKDNDFNLSVGRLMPQHVRLDDLQVQQNGDPDKRVILLIEDNTDILEYLSSIFRSDYQVNFALHGQEGINKALELIPDIIISDVMMPEKDGYAVCDFLKNNENTSHIPVILLTAKAGMSSRITGIQKGADAYLSKPFHKEELLSWVEQLIKGRQRLQNRYNSLQKLQENLADQSSEDFIYEDAYIKKLNDFLELNYSESELSIQDLCRHFAKSRTQLHRKIKALTNHSMIEYINQFRLEKAYKKLSQKSMNVSEVAYSCGYNDPKYFSKLFQEQFHILPSELK